MIGSLFPNVADLSDEFLKATYETIYMTGVTAAIAGVLGIMLGVIMVVTDSNGVFKNKIVYNFLDKFINVFRSIPFLILLVVVVPITRMIVGTSIGTTAAIVPLTIATTPFFARQIQNALVEVDYGLVEAAISMGATPLEIVYRVYLKEGLPSMIRAGAVTIINLIGATTMAGAVGAGGIGNLAITRGYSRLQNDVTIVSTIIILVLVFITQIISNYFIKKTTH